MNPFFVAFFLLPPVLVFLSLATRRKRLWPGLAVFCLAGWILVVFGIEWHFDALKKEIDSHPDPPGALLDTWANDGAKKVFGLFFGWLYSLIYFAPWMAFGCLMRWLLNGDGNEGITRTADPSA